MIVKLTHGQLGRLSELFIDLAKGLFLAALAVPAVAKETTTLDSLKSIIAGLFFTYLSLKAEELREVG